MNDGFNPECRLSVCFEVFPEGQNPSQVYPNPREFRGGWGHCVANESCPTWGPAWGDAVVLFIAHPYPYPRAEMKAPAAPPLRHVAPGAARMGPKRRAAQNRAVLPLLESVTLGPGLKGA